MALTNLEKIVQDGHRYYQQSYTEKKALIDERNFSLPAIRSSPQESYSQPMLGKGGSNRNITPIGPTSGNLKEYLAEIAEKSSRKKPRRNPSKNSSQADRSGAVSMLSLEEKKGHFAVPANLANSNTKL